MLSAFNVMDYGAVGNGTHDDTAAIQAAINAAGAAGGGTVYFPTKSFGFSSTLKLSSPGVELRGTKPSNEQPGVPACTYLTPLGTWTTDMIEITASDCALTNFTLYCNAGTQTAGWAVNCYGTSSAYIYGPNATNVVFAAGIWGGLNLEYVDNSNWTNFYFEAQTTGNVISVANSTLITFTNGGPATNGVGSTGWYFNTIEGVNIYGGASQNGTNNCAYALYATGVADSIFQDFAVNGVASGGTGIYCTGCDDIRFIRTYIDNFNEGNGFDLESCGTVWIDSPEIIDVNGTGIKLNSSVGVTISNIAYGNNADATGIAVDVEGNSYEFNMHDGYINGTATGQTGILWNATGANADNLGVVHDLTFGGDYYNSADAVVLGSSAGGAYLHVHDCPGYNPQGLETVTVPASGTAVARAFYDRIFYITAGSSTCVCSLVGIAGAQTIATIPSGGFAAVHVPSGGSFSVTYTAAPTWTVQGL